jgi:hypothetical protein
MGVAQVVESQRADTRRGRDAAVETGVWNAVYFGAKGSSTGYQAGALICAADFSTTSGNTNFMRGVSNSSDYGSQPADRDGAAQGIFNVGQVAYRFALDRHLDSYRCTLARL